MLLLSMWYTSSTLVSNILMEGYIGKCINCTDDLSMEEATDNFALKLWHLSHADNPFNEIGRQSLRMEIIETPTNGASWIYVWKIRRFILHGDLQVPQAHLFVPSPNEKVSGWLIHFARCLTSPAPWLFVHQLVRVNNKEAIEVLHY